jgi:uncharacterized membrane protein
MNAYTLIKFLHILLAIIAVGFNASYGIWIARAARAPEHLLYSLRGIKFLDDRLANPAYGLLLLTGLTMVFVGHLSLTTFWLAAAIVLWLALMLTGFFVFTPTLRDQLRLLEASGAPTPEFEALGRRARLVGVVLTVMVVVIVFLMVTKPTL